MRVNEARPPRFRHGLVLHDGAAHAVARMLPIATATAARGGVLAADLSDEVSAQLRERLEVDEFVGLTPLTRAARSSGQTVAAWRARELRAMCSGGRELLVLAEHDPDLDGPDGSYWTEYEAALNISLGGLPITQVCAFPQLPLHRVVSESAVANHPLTVHGTELSPNRGYRSADEVLVTMPVAPPHLLGPPDVLLTYNTFELSRVRGAVEEAVRDCRLDSERADDMVLAVNEIATNAVEHGSAQAELLLWSRPGELICELHDDGDLPLPLIGLAPPHQSQPRGRGTWIARQLCDSLHVWRDGSGTHVRLLTHA